MTTVRFFRRLKASSRFCLTLQQQCVMRPAVILIAKLFCLYSGDKLRFPENPKTILIDWIVPQNMYTSIYPKNIQSQTKNCAVYDPQWSYWCLCRLEFRELCLPVETAGIKLHLSVQNPHFPPLTLQLKSLVSPVWIRALSHQDGPGDSVWLGGECRKVSHLHLVWFTFTLHY